MSRLSFSFGRVPPSRASRPGHSTGVSPIPPIGLPGAELLAIRIVILFNRSLYSNEEHLHGGVLFQGFRSHFDSASYGYPCL
jgi:hypothetical protein